MSARRAALVAALVLGVALAVVIAVRTPWTVLPEPPGGHTPLDPTAGLTADQLEPGRVLRRRPPAGVPALPGPRARGRRGPRAHPPRRPAGPRRRGTARRRMGLAGAAGRRVARRHRPAGHAAALGVRRDGPAPLRAVDAELGPLDPRRRCLHRDRRRADRVRAAGAGLARPPGAAHLVGLGGCGGRRARGRRVVPVAGRHRAGVQPLRVDARRPAAHRPDRAGGGERHARCRTSSSPTPPAGRPRSTPTSRDSASTRRIVVYDTVLDRLPDEQIESIAAHELGHVAADDVLTGTLMGALGRRRGRRGAGLAGDVRRACCRRTGADSPGDPRIIPLVLFLIAVGTVVATPVQNLVSRHIEARADVHALDLTADPDAFVDMQRGLAVANLSDPDPPAAWQWFFGSADPHGSRRRRDRRPRARSWDHGWADQRRDPHPGGHQRLPAPAGRHPDLRGRAAGAPAAGLGRRPRLGLPGVGRARRRAALSRRPAPHRHAAAHARRPRGPPSTWRAGTAATARSSAPPRRSG